MSTLLSLNSDNQFITSLGEETIQVHTYEGDVNDFNTVGKTSFHYWSNPVYVGRGQVKYKGLEVFGTTIEGDKLKQLAEDLNEIDDDGQISIWVNRVGLCIIRGISRPTIKAMRINDYFGWSKYGVKLPQDVTSFTVWNRADMYSGATLIDDLGMGNATEEANKELAAACKKELEEKEMELAACKKELEEFKATALTACRKELEWSKKIESLQSELMTKKDKEVETMKSQLVAVKDILGSLIN